MKLMLWAHRLHNTQHHRSEIFDNYTDMQEYAHFYYFISLKNKTNERKDIQECNGSLRVKTEKNNYV